MKNTRGTAYRGHRLRPRPSHKKAEGYTCEVNWNKLGDSWGVTVRACFFHQIGATPAGASVQTYYFVPHATCRTHDPLKKWQTHEM